MLSFHKRVISRYKNDVAGSRLPRIHFKRLRTRGFAMNLQQPHPESTFNGAAIIDDNDCEVPITEAMIQQACKRLEHLGHYPADDNLKRLQTSGTR
ncbi:PA1571 family protein [Alcanivorax sp. P2S70]|uniref:PA1571 family protein n=1 Tax=Alcanivorax sp. P2S70 TaxID=1397527 RepID=UPI003FA39E9F